MNKLTHFYRTLACSAILISFIFATGCTSMYLDGALEEIDSSKYQKPDPVMPVQAVFEFQTEGVSNERATAHLKEQVFEQIENSGLFSQVSETPVDGGRMLSITLNNVPLTDADDAAAKGFVAGFTFGLVGAQVTDGYICTARYTSDKEAKGIEKKAQHAIHATVGNASAPPNAVKAKGIEDAVTSMTRQVVSNVLYDLSKDSDFK